MLRVSRFVQRFNSAPSASSKILNHQVPTSQPVQNAATAFKQLEEKMIRSFRLDQVLSQVTTNDIVIAKQDSSRYSFLGFKDLAALDVGRSLLLVPEHMRRFHTVCAREKAPCDFYADIDLAKDVDGEEVLLQVTDRVNAKLKAIGFGSSTTVILQSHHEHKLSYHLHVRGEKSAFTDFRAVRAIADGVNLQMGNPVVDMNCYRYNATLRTAFCAKLTPSSKGTALLGHLVPLVAKDDELARRLVPMSELSAERLFEVSLINRQIPTETFPDAKPLQLFNALGLRDKLGKALAADGMNTNEEVGGHRFLREDVKWLRYKSAITKLRQLPTEAAEDYLTWIAVGLALHSFGVESHIFEEWARFSLRCPEKFSREACQAKWVTFNSTAEPNNWRRGYNYLMTSVWRRFGSHITTDSHKPRF
eukprot:GILI01004218.1.p1 GENE.GILI01004218.1~~GILI01004218.1.p1  ORF type:complete len:419 (+),score=80.56 GILI01004218.1:397-1653(+)